MSTFNAEREHMRAIYGIFQRFALEDQRRYWIRTTARYRKAAAQVNLIVALFSFLTGFSAALAGLLVSAYLVEGSFVNGGACADLKSSRGLVTTLRDLGVIGQEDEIEALRSLNVTSDVSTIDSGAVQQAVTALVETQGANCDFIQAVVNVLMILAVVTPAIGGAFTTLASLYQWDRQVSLYEGALENLEVVDSQSPLDDMDDLTYKAALRAYVENTLRVMAEETAQWGQSVRTPPELKKFVEEERRKAARASRSRGSGPLTTESDQFLADEEAKNSGDTTP
jgi:hypothetical protein